MSFYRRIFSSNLRTSALCSLALAVLPPYTAQAFNPNEGAELVAPSTNRVALPSTMPLLEQKPRLIFQDISTSRSLPQENVIVPLNAAEIARPKFAFPENNTTSEQAIAARQAPIENSNTEIVTPKLSVSENKNTTGELASAEINPPAAKRQVPVENSSMDLSLSTAPALPPVDDAVAQRAAQELASMQNAAIETTATSARSFAAPTPLLSSASSASVDVVRTDSSRFIPEKIAPIPNAEHLPMALTTLPIEAIPAPSTQLSDTSKKVLSVIPSKLDKIAPTGGNLAISRMSTDIKPLEKNTKVESFDSGGLSIKVQRPGLDSNFELNRAYTALMGGETSAAIDIYKNILSSEPNNKDALFGLASTYHRTGNLDQARPYYATLLKNDPNHREGLNNFLALISDESPQEALAELERLEQRNPDFSPIPAQQAILLAKLGYADRARDKMMRAIELAPDNLTYKYNLAVMMDKSGYYADAGALYRLLIEAAMNGQKIPATAASLQKRLNFIAAARPSTGTPAGS